MRHRVLDDHAVGLGKTLLEIADHPFVLGLAKWQHVGGGVREVLLGPLELIDLRPRALALDGHAPKRIAIEAGIRAAGAQALDGIERKGKRLQLHFQRLDGVGGRELVDGRYCSDRLSLVERFARETRLVHGVLGTGHILRRQDRLDPVHRQRCAGVDVDDSGMRHGAQEELCEEHAVGPKVLGIAGPAGELGLQIGRNVIRTVEFSSHLKPSVSTRPHAWPSSGSCCSRRSDRGCRRAPGPLPPGSDSGSPAPWPPST